MAKFDFEKSVRLLETKAEVLAKVGEIFTEMDRARKSYEERLNAGDFQYDGAEDFYTKSILAYETVLDAMKDIDWETHVEIFIRAREN